MQHISLNLVLLVCRVGTGLTDAERQTVNEKLKPYMLPATKNNVPAAYRITGTKKERPDFWISDYTKSIVLQASVASYMSPTTWRITPHSVPTTSQYVY